MKQHQAFAFVPGYRVMQQYRTGRTMPSRIGRYEMFAVFTGGLSHLLTSFSILARTWSLVSTREACVRKGLELYYEIASILVTVVSARSVAVDGFVYDRRLAGSTASELCGVIHSWVPSV